MYEFVNELCIVTVLNTLLISHATMIVHAGCQVLVEVCCLYYVSEVVAFATVLCNDM